MSYFTNVSKQQIKYYSFIELNEQKRKRFKIVMKTNLRNGD